MLQLVQDLAAQVLYVLAEVAWVPGCLMIEADPWRSFG